MTNSEVSSITNSQSSIFLEYSCVTSWLSVVSVKPGQKAMYFAFTIIKVSSISFSYGVQQRSEWIVKLYLEISPNLGYFLS